MSYPIILSLLHTSFCVPLPTFAIFHSVLANLCTSYYFFVQFWRRAHLSIYKCSVTILLHHFLVFFRLPSKLIPTFYSTFYSSFVHFTPRAQERIDKCLSSFSRFLLSSCVAGNGVVTTTKLKAIETEMSTLATRCYSLYPRLLSASRFLFHLCPPHVVPYLYILSPIRRLQFYL